MKDPWTPLPVGYFIISLTHLYPSLWFNIAPSHHLIRSVPFIDRSMTRDLKSFLWQSIFCWQLLILSSMHLLFHHWTMVHCYAWSGMLCCVIRPPLPRINIYTQRVLLVVMCLCTCLVQCFGWIDNCSPWLNVSLVCCWVSMHWCNALPLKMCVNWCSYNYIKNYSSWIAATARPWIWRSLNITVHCNKSMP